ncbi:MAG: nucleotidyltransferase [Clostridia bacterium]|nr:nucleotidyltransferase [Clostridia bacterium]
MKICGIVAEYNPFHNGHLYHIEKSKEITNSDIVVAIMSGNFIQRGLPALFDKWTRTKIAIQNGADIVIELPVCYATSSAEYFAHGSIGILDSLNVTNSLCFGNECEDIEILKRIANVLFHEPDEYKRHLQSELKKGNSYPIARSNALKVFLKKEYNEQILSNILLDSNNILGIEYLKALLAFDSPITPYSLKRKGGNYNSTEIYENICSSTAIRQMFKSGNISPLSNVVPENCANILNQELLHGRSPMFIENFEKEILYEIRRMSPEDLTSILDVTEGLENLIKKAENECIEIDNLINTIKSKRYTRTRIQRILIHLLLGIKQDIVENNKTSPQYARVLGLSKNGEKALPYIINNSRIPVITSVNKFLKGNINESQKQMLELDILASNIYTLGYQIPNFKKTNLDYTMPIIKED